MGDGLQSVLLGPLLKYSFKHFSQADYGDNNIWQVSMGSMKTAACDVSAKYSNHPDES